MKRARHHGIRAAPSPRLGRARIARVFRDRLAAFDLSLFGHVESQTTNPDKLTLLALHAAIADRLGTFAYLEIGSYKGGSLQALVVDPRCRRIVSIDPRPAWVPDNASAAGCAYPDNSTEEMLDRLASVPGADLTKLETTELGTEDIDPAAMERPDICFVDGEHTDGAALRDARFCREILRGRGVIAFHDFQTVDGAVTSFLRESPGARGYLLRTSVFVVELAVPTLLSDARVAARTWRPAVLWRGLNALRAVPLALATTRLGR